ncbi:MAG TPA: methionine gamma-lyase family protein [Candidatus Baltobacteraceae bacterium]|nr:methionine gamma-lyase family protein [Candidatus Baltobacteraceae bacterium]
MRDAALRAFQTCSTLEYAAQAAAKVNVIAAFLEEGIAEHDLAGTTGYGYDDAARAHYESLLARILGAERALARLSFVSGTHAIVAALAACTPPGRTLLSITGKPYDTLRNAIAQAPFSLVENGIEYREVAFPCPSIPQGASIPQHDDAIPQHDYAIPQHDDAIPQHDGVFDLEAIARELENEKLATIFVQRSRGYAPRPSVGIAQCEQVFAFIKSRRPDVAILVDNCYGELVEEREPSHAGADLVMGSLIKNLGGSLAPGGGYVAGRADLVERVAARVYAPGLGDALGPTFGLGRALIQGLFLAPLIVEQCLRGLDFAAAVFAGLGFPVDPLPGCVRTDIVQAIRLGTAARLERFAQALQTAMPVNARFRPEPGPVPGYVDPVIMSSGAFVSGATIELSCDAPLREPFEVYLQGGVIAEHTMVGVLVAARSLLE